MADITPPVNQTASTINDVISSGESAIVSMAEGMIIAAVPWLGWPGIKQIWELLFNWIAGYFEKAAATGATFAVIDVQVGSEEGALSKALRSLIAAEKGGDPNAIKAAIKAYADAESALAHSDGSAPVH